MADHMSSEHLIGCVGMRTARNAAMDQARECFGRTRLPDILHHPPEQGASHVHAHWQGQDRDGDGLIDHLAIWAPGGLDTESRTILDGITQLRIGKACWGLVPAAQIPCDARLWISATPFIGPRRVWSKPGKPKKGEGLGLIDQFWREATNQQDLPPIIEVAAIPRLKKQSLGPWLIGDSRGSGAPHHAVWGNFAVLFREPPQRDFAFGALSHWGLGAFRPAIATDLI
jgi:hypothetical protein